MFSARTTCPSGLTVKLYILYICVLFPLYSLRWSFMFGRRTEQWRNDLTFCWLSRCSKETWRTEIWLLELYKDGSVAVRYHETSSTRTCKHIIFLLSCPINYHILPNLFTIFWKNALFSILLGLAFVWCTWQEWLVCFSLINQRIKTYDRFTTSTYIHGVCRTPGVILGTGIPRKWALWSVPVSMVSPYQRGVHLGPGAFVKSLWKDGSVFWGPRPGEGRIPLWLRLSWSCAAQRIEEWWGKTQKQHVRLLEHGQ